MGRLTWQEVTLRKSIVEAMADLFIFGGLPKGLFAELIIYALSTGGCGKRRFQHRVVVGERHCARAAVSYPDERDVESKQLCCIQGVIGSSKNIRVIFAYCALNYGAHFILVNAPPVRWRSYVSLNRLQDFKRVAFIVDELLGYFLRVTP